MPLSPANAALPEAAKDCPLCPRLVAYRAANATEQPSWHNGAVASFGDEAARLLIVGLAPGRGGANRTGRPFTGDFAGDLLYGSLLSLGIAAGQYGGAPSDGLVLHGAMITNAVRCAPPANKPTPQEASHCRPFLAARMAALPRLRAILALGAIAHEAVLRCHDLPLRTHAFAHGARHALPAGPVLFSSYHCSRYNTQTRRLTPDMFMHVLAAAWTEAGG
jgi:uracil-DNA glycosylase